MKKTKRQVALEIIKLEYAKHGIGTLAAQRAYTENNISYSTFQEAAKKGLRAYKLGKG